MLVFLAQTNAPHSQRNLPFKSSRAPSRRAASASALLYSVRRRKHSSLILGTVNNGPAETLIPLRLGFRFGFPNITRPIGIGTSRTNRTAVCRRKQGESPGLLV